jgi:hypothetical protein
MANVIFDAILNGEESKKKKLGEEPIVYFPCILNGSHRKRKKKFGGGTQTKNKVISKA